jgi:hypothetical protein
MKISSLLALFCLPCALLVSNSCNYTKPVMYIDIANRSGHPLENLEMKHPSGTFGLSMLRDQQTHQHMAPLGSPCKFTLAFDDQAGKHHVGDYDLGAKCPTEMVFEVGAGMRVSQRTERP